APGASSLLVETCGQCASETGVSPAIEPPRPARTAGAPAQSRPAVTLRRWVDESYRTGRQLLVMFLGFAFLGYFINGLVPAAWVAAVFGGENVYSVPLAATLGLPFYINSEGSLPLVRALIDNGMSQGAALAFLITGAGTSIGALGGALTIARWRVVGIVVGTLWAGSVLLGYLYDLLLAMG
ncbi:MAG TPA: permease, partial [Anaerolineaceae bacterium]|nr:permease [Anaerolineaceae bacterium]